MKLAAALLCVSLALGCESTRTCKQHSFFLRLDYQGAAANADTLVVQVVVGSSERKQSFAIPSSHQGTLAIEFPDWPANQTVIVRLAAYQGATVVAFLELPIVAAGACVAKEVTLADQSPGDALVPVEDGGSDGAASDAAVPDLSSTDLSAACMPGKVTLTREHSQALIVLDRSGSMADTAPIDGGMQKWTLATSAVKQATAQTQSEIDWGLSFFPNDDVSGCGANPSPAVTPSPASAAAIASALDAQMPNNATPTADAITFAANYLETQTAPVQAMVLVTDGQPTCPLNGGSTDPVMDAITAIHTAFTKGIKTYVLGVGTATSGEIDPATLNSMASNGGTGTPSYVNTQAELLSAINNISSQVVACVYDFPSAPPVPSQVSVTAGSLQVPRDTTHADGWDFVSAGSLKFYGSWCSALQSGSIDMVQAIVPCS